MKGSPEADAAPQAKNGVPSLTLGIVFLTLFIDLVGFSIIFPLFPAILDFYLPLEEAQGGLLKTLITFLSNIVQNQHAEPQFMTTVLFGGVLGSIYALLQFITAPFFGRLSDRIGRRSVLIITLSGTALSYLIWALSGSFYLLLISRLLSGAMSGNLSVAIAAIADVTTRKNRAKGMALVGIAFGLGFILGPAIGGLSSKLNLLESYPDWAQWGINPFSVPAAIALVLALINLFSVITYFKESLSTDKRPTRAQKPSNRRITAIFKVQSADIRRANLIYFLVILPFSGMEFTLTFLAVERLAFSPVQNGLLFVFIGFFLILTQGLGVRRLAPLVGEKYLVLTGIGIGGLALFGTAYAMQLPSFLISQALLAIGIGLFNPSLSSLVSLYASETTQGRHMGAFRSVASLARAMGPILAASLYFYFGSRFSYLTGALLMLSPLILAIRLTQPKKEETE